MQKLQLIVTLLATGFLALLIMVWLEATVIHNLVAKEKAFMSCNALTHHATTSDIAAQCGDLQKQTNTEFLCDNAHACWLEQK